MTQSPHDQDHDHDHAHDHGHDHSDDHGHAHDHDHDDHDHDGHDHDHDHGILGHSHGPAPGEGWVFPLTVGLNTAFVVVELVCGWSFGSLALVSDALHNLSDVAGLLLAWFAAWIATSPPAGQRTFGWRKATVWAALLNALSLIVASAVIGYEAWERLQSPVEVNDGVMLGVALVGVIINAASAALFMRGDQHDLNRRAAFMHLVADAAVSVGVVLGALVLGATGWMWFDPALSMVIGVVVALGSVGILRRATALALDQAPEHLDPAKIREVLLGTEGVTEVHDLHIWAMSAADSAMTAHLVLAPGAAHEPTRKLATDLLRARFKLHHITLQTEDQPCGEGC
jgi:cobalt-zinc-cadmium efflux system protein